MRAVVLRSGRLEVREADDPVPGSGRAAAADAEHGDLCVGRALHGPPRDGDRRPDGAFALRRRSRHRARPRVRRRGHRAWPGCTGPVPGRHAGHVDSDSCGQRRRLDGVRIIGQHPEAQGSFGELVVVPEVDGQSGRRRRVQRRRRGRRRVRGRRVLRAERATSQPGEIPIVVGAGAIGLSAVAALASRGVEPIVVIGLQPRAPRARRGSSAPTSSSTPPQQSPFDVWRELRVQRGRSGPWSSSSASAPRV